MKEDTWTPTYEKWRHGGWYVTNVRYPSGACGCVSRNYPDKKWRIVTDYTDNAPTYPTRDAAARAERAIALAIFESEGIRPDISEELLAALYKAAVIAIEGRMYEALVAMDGEVEK